MKKQNFKIFWLFLLISVILVGGVWAVDFVKPDIVSRTEWGCPDEQSSPRWDPEYKDITHIIIHHTDTPNQLPWGQGVNTWDKAVHKIWDMHALNSGEIGIWGRGQRGWGDIGYNYLIDPNGVIYEGRAGGDNVVGGHALEHNYGTMGIAFLGTFSNVEPTSNALRSAEKLIAWKFSQENIDPFGSGKDLAGTHYNYIAGHRDVSPGNECPGQKLYNLLPTIKQNVFNILNEAETNNLPTITAFSVTPLNIILDESFTITYKAKDDNELVRAELWRANDDNGQPGTWNEIKRKAISGATYSGSFTDTPDLPATYWYGVHVVDDSGDPEHWNDERNSQTNGLPGVYGPIQVKVVQCTDQCSSGETRCNGDIKENCVYDNGCWVWGGGVSCAYGCSNNKCNSPPKCSDGTSHGSCSLTKPKYCINGNLVNNCQTCGCQSEQTCQQDGSCSKCTCGSWQNKGCGQGSCSSNEIYQTRTCTPEKCNDQERCIADANCISDGWKSPTSTGNTYNNWHNPRDAFESDNKRAWRTYLDNNRYYDNQNYRDFHFNIPERAIINGLEIKVEGYCDRNVNNAIRISFSGHDGNGNQQSQKFGTSEEIKTFGGPNDLWGASWDVDDLSDENFNLDIVAYASGRIATNYINSIQAKVHYTEVECLQDNDCSDDYYSDNYCKENDIYRDLHDFNCINNECIEEVTSELIEECIDICVEGECTEIICSSDSDCGIDDYIGDSYCNSVSNNSIYQDWIDYTCHNPGQADSYCSNKITPVFSEDCGKDYCDDWNTNYCENNDIYKSRTCYNKGCSNGNCFNSPNQEEQLVEECTDICVNGECVEVTCYNNGDCDDSDEYTLDECVNPGTAESYCNYKNLDCLIDSDCNDNQFCNGIEICSQNTCQAGTPVNCYDNKACTTDSCNENLDSCEYLEIDLDKDSYSICPGINLDCNDANPNIFPGANEVCDKLDNDCDGEVDEGCDCYDNTQDPIPLCTCNDLQKIREDLDRNYELKNNIDCSGAYFTPIGYSNGNYWQDNHGTGFTGKFDGQGYRISNLKINSDSYGAGLFAYTDGASIHDVGLKNINVKGYSGVGALIGYAFDTQIEEVYSSGSVSAQGNYAGGIVSLLSNSNIYNSYSKAYVSGNHEVGGAVGYMEQDANLVNTHATGSVISSCKGGGLVGETYSSGKIENSFATGYVYGMGCSEGGLIGLYSGDTAISNSYWYSGSHSSCTGENYASDCYPVSDINEFYDIYNEPMVKWDFGNIWQEVEGDYPVLKSQVSGEAMWLGNNKVTNPFYSFFTYN